MQTKLMEMAELGQLILGIAKQRVAFDVEVQQAAYQCIGQSIVHRNSTPAADLYEAVGPHLKAVVLAYFERFGNLCWSKTEKKVIFFDVAKRTDLPALEWTETYAAKVAEFIWTKAKKEPTPVSIYDVQEECDKFLERLMKAVKKGAELKHKALLERLSETFNRYTAETFLASVTAAPTEQDVADAKTPADKAKLEALRQHFGAKPQLAA